MSVTQPNQPQRVKQPAEAGADGKYECIQVILRVGHSSHKLRNLGAITIPGQANRQALDFVCKTGIAPRASSVYAYQAKMVILRCGMPAIQRI